MADLVLFPATRPVERGLAGRARVAAQRAAARAAFADSAAAAGAPLRELAWQEDAPAAPRDGWHGSRSHAAGLAVALCAPPAAGPVGVDVEWLARPRLGVVRAQLDASERALAGDAPLGLARAWSAKEAVLKLVGVGVAGLPRCRVVALEQHAARVAYEGRTFRVAQYVEDEHVVAVACAREPFALVRAGRGIGATP